MENTLLCNVTKKLMEVIFYVMLEKLHYNETEILMEIIL